MKGLLAWLPRYGYVAIAGLLAARDHVGRHRLP